MPTRIAFSTHFPDRMGDLAGKFTRFPEKIVNGLFRSGMDWKVLMEVAYPAIENLDKLTAAVGHPKTTTIRSNFDYWKSKEGQLIQPFFWAGKPYRSKQVVFCPAVRLKKVRFIRILHMEGRNVYIGEKEGDEMPFYIDDEITGGSYGDDDMQRFAHNEGFNSVDDFFKWFNKDFDGALLEFKRVEG